VILRDYQLEAVEAVYDAYQRGIHRAIISLPTGCGKTALMPALYQRMVTSADDVMLILAHRDELVSQAARRIKQDLPDRRVGSEKAELRAHPSSNVIVASVQSLHAGRMRELLHRFHHRIALMIVDECHHAVADGYTRAMTAVLTERPDALVVGVTATVPRHDGLALGRVFEEVVYHRDMRWAIEQGWLVPPSCYTMASETDLATVGVDRGDYALGSLSRVVDTPGRNALIVAAYQRHLAGKKTIVFCTTVNHARNLHATFLEANIAAAWASGEMPVNRREATLRAFASGRTRVLVNCMLWVEGFDEPTVEAVINCRPTKSRSLYVQIIGRGTRPHPGIASELGKLSHATARCAAIASSAKPIVTVIDIVDAHSHDLVTLPSILGRAPKVRETDGDDRIVATSRPADPSEPEQRGDDAISSDASATPGDAAADPHPDGPSDVAAQSAPETTPPLAPPTRESTELIGADRFGTGAHLESNVPYLRWTSLQAGHYFLSLPTHYMLGDRDVNAEVLAAYRQSGRIESALRKVARTHGCDPGEIVLPMESLSINADDDRWNVSLQLGSTRRELGSVAQQHEAFTRAESWVANNRPNVRDALLAIASWKEKSVTPAQRQLLERLGSDRIPTTRGDASELITALIEEQRRSA
jgi:superfamily II DNA or RNA helicase